MNKADAAKLLKEMGIDPNTIVTTQVTMRDMLMLNELVEAARTWNAESIYAGASDCPHTARLTEAIDEYVATEERAKKATS